MVVNQCSAPALPIDPTPFQYTCKEGPGSVTVDKQTYAAGDATCALAAVSTRIASHVHKCAPPVAPVALLPKTVVMVVEGGASL